jgi:hypothetical protein
MEGKKMTYPGGGENAGDTEHSNVDPAMPGPRVSGLVHSDSEGQSLTDGLGMRKGIHDVTPESIGADNQGGGQVHMQHPKTSAPRGTRFG